MNKPWYQTHLRRFLLDMHMEDWDEQIFAKFDVNEYFSLLQKGNGNAVMLYTQTHTGLSFFPTKIGRMHKAMVGKEGDLSKLFTLCANAGMKTIAYYSLIYNNLAYDLHPSWRMVNPFGFTSRETGGRYGLCCPNNMEYRAFVKAQIEETFEMLPPFDGIFFDMTFFPMLCRCNACKERWMKEEGGELPDTIDWENPRWRLFAETRNRWLGEFAQFATAVVKRKSPTCSVEHQYGNASMDFWRRGVTENVALASDYIGTDLHGDIATQSFACKAWYNLTQNQPFQYMHVPQILDRTTVQTHEQLLRFAMMVYAHHGAAMYIDDVVPDGSLDHRVYEAIGKVYREIEPLEAYTKSGTLSYDVALFLDMTAKYDPEQKGLPLRSSAVNERRVPYMDAIIRASRTLAACHIPYGVVNSGKRELIYERKAVAVTDAPSLQQEDITTLEKYLLEGGVLYLSGHSALSIVETYLGIHPIGMSKEENVFYRPRVTDSIFADFDPTHPFGIPESILLFSGVTTGELLATVDLPYNESIGMGMFGDNDGSQIVPIDDEKSRRFPAIHGNRAFIQTNHPALIRKKVGKGTLIWSAAPLEKYMIYPLGSLFVRLLEESVGVSNFSFRITAPEQVEAVLFEDFSNRRLLLTLVNQQDAPSPLPIVDLTLRLKCPQKPSAVRVLPEEQELSFQWDGDTASISLERLEVYKLLVILF